MRRPLLAVAVVTALVLPGAAAGGGGIGGPAFGYGPHVQEARAVGACTLQAARVVRYRTCLVASFLQLIERTHDPADELPQIDAYVHTTNGWLANNCHVLMHAVGRKYAAAAHVTLENLLDYLPKTNDPGCSAGFAHGMLITLGPQIQKLGPSGAAAECAKATTRYERYSCVHGLGHAYARIYLDFPLPSVASCRQLGPEDAVDCAQGVFHDYWIAVDGLDNTKQHPDMTTSPRALCGQYRGDFARACWYRAFLERPPAKPVDSAGAMLALCRGLGGVQAKGCITGASVIRSSDPFEQMATCARLPAVFGVACARGVRVPAVALSPRGQRVGLIAACGAFAAGARDGCYWWLGKALNVVTNGTFGARNCPNVGAPDARRACAAGAAAYEGPLVTFS